MQQRALRRSAVLSLIWRYKEMLCAAVALLLLSQVAIFSLMSRSLPAVLDGEDVAARSSALMRKQWSKRTIEMNARLIEGKLAQSAVGNSTVFVLRIQKAGSSQSERLFGMLTFNDKHRARLHRASPSCQVFADCTVRCLWSVRRTGCTSVWNSHLSSRLSLSLSLSLSLRRAPALVAAQRHRPRCILTRVPRSRVSHALRPPRGPNRTEAEAVEGLAAASK